MVHPGKFPQAGAIRGWQNLGLGTHQSVVTKRGLVSSLKISFKSLGGGYGDPPSEKNRRVETWFDETHGPHVFEGHLDRTGVTRNWSSRPHQINFVRPGTAGGVSERSSKTHSVGVRSSCEAFIAQSQLTLRPV